jgi:hypothetical protein
MKEDICKNQTPFKFLVYLENSIFRSVSKKVYEIPPNLPYVTQKTVDFFQPQMSILLYDQLKVSEIELKKY